ncbi:MAG: MBL fold metallo-hydrolase [Paludibacteraceae bacterium]|nr:MBL fold metallo-hydrolase [Paludibacteraceae bacterium]
MKLIRTFHPVGHGAFYTERFYNNDVCVFTAVYDCGGSPLGGLREYIRQYFLVNSDNKIDALFVSHLHNDHISGIKYLLPYCKKLFLPVLSNEQVLLSYVHNIIHNKGILNNSANVSIESIYNHSREDGGDEVKVIYVEPSREEMQQTNISEPIDIDTLSDGQHIPARTPIKCGNLNWMYFPYNIQSNVPNALLNHFSTAIINGEIDFSIVKSIYESNPSVVKSIYTTAYANLHNEYSMTVYSGHINNDICENFSNCCNVHQRCYLCGDCCLEIGCPILANCLYMGDFPAITSNISDLKVFYGSYWRCAKTIQVPHHGSILVAGNYGYDLYNYVKNVVYSFKPNRFNGMPSVKLVLWLLQYNIKQHFVIGFTPTVYRQVYSVQIS